MSTIYHIVLPGDWAAITGDEYVPAAYATEGFIHCSYAHQLDSVLGRYYSDAASVIILEIEPGRLTSELIAEPSTGGEIYPHIYGPINREAIVAVSERTV